MLGGSVIDVSQYIGWIPSVIDFIVVYLIIYKLLLWINRTHIENLTRGLITIFAIYLMSRVLGLETLNWLLDRFATIIMIVLIIIFQPELRRFLEKIGTGTLFNPLLSGTGQHTVIVQQLLRAVDMLSKRKVGALIAIELGVNLSEYVESGVQIGGHITADLLASLFWPGSPTHDGAVILRENKIVAAGCLLPLTNTPLADRRLGTRHRAALGLSERSDALIIIVSEETGVISIAENSNITRFLNREALETRLFNLYKEESTPKASIFSNIKGTLFKRRHVGSQKETKPFISKREEASANDTL